MYFIMLTVYPCYRQYVLHNADCVSVLMKQLNGDYIVDIITCSNVVHLPSIMASTVGQDDVVGRKTYCFDLEFYFIFFARRNNFDLID